MLISIDGQPKVAGQKRKRHRRVAQCAHTKEDGVVCGSPALKRQRYCYFHAEVQRRRRRMARSHSNGKLQARAAQRTLAVLDRALKSPIVKNLTDKPLWHKILADTLRLRAKLSRLCETRERGGGRTAASPPAKR